MNLVASPFCSTKSVNFVLNEFSSHEKSSKFSVHEGRKVTNAILVITTFIILLTFTT